MNLPAHHQALMPYFIVDDAKQFSAFIQAAFDATILMTHLREDDQSIMHGEAMISGCTIMFSGATVEYPSAGIHLFLYVEDADASFKKAIAAGGKVVQELTDRDYGRTGGIDDGQGNVWWITALPGK